MARPNLGRRTLDSYTVKHIGKTIRPGDCVLMRPSSSSTPSYVARVEQIEADGRGGNVRVQVRWYYRPEESIGGRRQFHGSKEVFLSDHFDTQRADTIEGKCKVHSFKSYTKLATVANDDFFCRFEYNSSTGSFNPDRVAVYCKCEMPYNPDDLMIQCDGCSDWFHPTCMDMSPEEAERLDHFYCLICSPEDEKKSNNSRVSTRGIDVKVIPRRNESIQQANTEAAGKLSRRPTYVLIRFASIWTNGSSISTLPNSNHSQMPTRLGLM
ncbi:PHD finger family protein / bromo-adjacent homology domain-containing protein [Perilla frutescens var. hirtella]|uniref:PHD finger family protein / bromo-adjacent homology domain-containing protein n=1 Tax=Perilla frutescens var. hirtella TaxID=608512 RepID=A0AAD4NZ92_PERFH|nr:PHD finger family protein / bromo-adjacent homology domain-containing protein [Perilla frutescens var. hirtella]